MNNFQLPTRSELDLWLKFVSETLASYLPPYNPRWSEHMLSCFRVAALAPDSNNLCRLGARIFYKIAKNHYLVDGNKRSAVICTYFFFLLNGHDLDVTPSSLYKVAIAVVEDKELDSDEAIDILAEEFFPVCKPIKT